MVDGRFKDVDGETEANSLPEMSRPVAEAGEDETLVEVSVVVGEAISSSLRSKLDTMGR